MVFSTLFYFTKRLARPINCRYRIERVTADCNDWPRRAFVGLHTSVLGKLTVILLYLSAFFLLIHTYFHTKFVCIRI